MTCVQIGIWQLFDLGSQSFELEKLSCHAVELCEYSLIAITIRNLSLRIPSFFPSLNAEEPLLFWAVGSGTFLAKRAMTFSYFKFIYMRAIQLDIGIRCKRKNSLNRH